MHIKYPYVTFFFNYIVLINNPTLKLEIESPTLQQMKFIILENCLFPKNNKKLLQFFYIIQDLFIPLPQGSLPFFNNLTLDVSSIEK